MSSKTPEPMSLDDTEEDATIYFCSKSGKKVYHLSKRVVLSGISGLLKATFENETEEFTEKNPFKLVQIPDKYMGPLFSYIRAYDGIVEANAPPAPADEKKSISACLGKEAPLLEFMFDSKKSSQENLVTCISMLKIAEWLMMEKLADKISCIAAKFIQGKEVEVVQKELEYVRKHIE